MNGKDELITPGRLAAEIRALRWEMRCLIAIAALANLGVAYGLKVPPVPQAVEFVLGLI